MLSWVSGSLIKNLLLAGVVIGAAASIYTMYVSVINLEVDNRRMQMEAERTAASVEAIEVQATLQATRAVNLNRKLRRVKQTLAIAESRIVDRDLTQDVKDDPEKAAKALQEEINALFSEIETIANTEDLDSVSPATE